MYPYFPNDCLASATELVCLLYTAVAAAFSWFLTTRW